MGKANVCHAMQRQGDTVTERAVDKQAAELPTFFVVSLAIALFMDHALFLNSVRQLRRRKKLFLSPLDLSLAQSSPYTQVALSGETHSEPIQGHVRQQAFCACPSSDML